MSSASLSISPVLTFLAVIATTGIGLPHQAIWKSHHLGGRASFQFAKLMLSRNALAGQLEKLPAVSARSMLQLRTEYPALLISALR